MADERAGAMQIGRVLKDARQRAGLDIRTVEEKTKIRTRYLRALENEEWEALPTPAYAKGFLRTYANALGLDGEALVDEFRRQVEPLQGASSYPLGDQVLERPRRLGQPPGGGRGPWPWIAAGVLAVAGTLLVLGLTGGDDEPAGERRGDSRQSARKEERREERRRERRAEERRVGAAADRVELELVVSSPVAVCLLGGQGQELIDGQVLAAGSEERFEAERFELRFPSGYDREFFELRVAGEPVRVPETQGPTAFTIKPPARVRRAPEPGSSCP